MSTNPFKRPVVAKKALSQRWRNSYITQISSSGETSYVPRFVDVQEVVRQTWIPQIT